jgi:acyl carrier protein
MADEELDIVVENRSEIEDAIEMTVLDKIKNIIIDITNSPPDDVNSQSVLGDNLGMDYIDEASLIERLEEEFGIVIDGEQINLDMTVKNLSEQVEIIIQSFSDSEE